MIIDVDDNRSEVGTTRIAESLRSVVAQGVAQT